MITIELPFPPKELSPNARVHWGKRSRAVKKARESGQFWGILNKNLFDKMFAGYHGPIPIHLKFVRPARYHYDEDNLEGSFKAMRDGLADGFGINDRRFKTTREIAEETVKNGKVIVTILEPAMRGL